MPELRGVFFLYTVTSQFINSLRSSRCGRNTVAPSRMKRMSAMWAHSALSRLKMGYGDCWLCAGGWRDKTQDRLTPIREVSTVRGRDGKSNTVAAAAGQPTCSYRQLITAATAIWRLATNHSGNNLLGRPTNLSADLGFTAILLLHFSSPTLRARWTELNQNRPHARK